MCLLLTYWTPVFERYIHIFVRYLHLYGVVLKYLWLLKVSFFPFCFCLTEVFVTLLSNSLSFLWCVNYFLLCTYIYFISVFANFILFLAIYFILLSTSKYWIDMTEFCTLCPYFIVLLCIGTTCCFDLRYAISYLSLVYLTNMYFSNI